LGREMRFVVILAGGIGRRFWPVSRRKRPKQLLRLTKSGKTMVQETFDRALRLAPPERILICTTRDLAERIASVRGLLEENLIVEPKPLNTLPALALSTVVAHGRDPDALIISLNSDHYVSDVEVFQRSIVEAATAAEQRGIVIVGVPPSRPETGYGYIRLGKKLGSVYKVERFVEKPGRQKASSYLRSGKYVWNSGIFVWRCNSFTRELSLHMPTVHRQMQRYAQFLGRPEAGSVLEEIYEKLPSVSIDYGLLEKSDNCFALVADFGWEDLGSWTALRAVWPTTDRGNVYPVGSKVVPIDADDCVLYTEGPLVVALGVRDLVIVATGDAILVSDKTKSQEIRKIADILEKKGMDGYL